VEAHLDKRLIAAVVGIFASLAFAAEPEQSPPKLLFDFEDPADVAAWTNLKLPEERFKEPPVRVELDTAHATSGGHSLKLTFGGGTWPTITTTHVDDEWLHHPTFEADVFVPRDCVVGFCVMQEKSQRGEGWGEMVSRWTKTEFCRAGANHVAGTIPQNNEYALHAKWGKVVRFEVFMYQPRDGEAIYVDSIRLTHTKPAPAAPTKFTLAGSGEVLSGGSSADAVMALGKKRKATWTAPQARSVEEIERDFAAQFAEVKAKHPKAVMSVLRDGEKGYDPAHPDAVFAGWKDAHMNSHGPDGMMMERARNRGDHEVDELFMRHRSLMMQVDLASIPRGSQVIAAKLVMVRAGKYDPERDPLKEASLWVAEPCNRPWEETQVNAFEFAHDKFWKAIGGMAWGEGGDFTPLLFVCGPGQGQNNAWEFTDAVRYWTDGKHENHGFMLHGDGHDYMQAFCREAKELKNRPAVLVIYEPKE
jgi:hypothetical protein